MNTNININDKIKEIYAEVANHIIGLPKEYMCDDHDKCMYYNHALKHSLLCAEIGTLHDKPIMDTMLKEYSMEELAYNLEYDLESDDTCYLIYDDNGLHIWGDIDPTDLIYRILDGERIAHLLLENPADFYDTKMLVLVGKYQALCDL